VTCFKDTVGSCRVSDHSSVVFDFKMTGSGLDGWGPIIEIRARYRKN
jgi:hypothetical protein